MNFIIKTVIKKVFQKYLNLQEQLNIESGCIKLPFGTINEEQINKKLEPFNLRISSSIYRNLTITIPITQIMSKPIRVSIQRFQVIIGKTKKTKIFQKKQTNNQGQTLSEQQMKIQIDDEISKIAPQAKKQQVSSGYIKNMVNRLLYNMEILIEKVVFSIQHDEMSVQAESPFQRYFSNAQFQINRLHLKNSMVLLQANIIKKIVNLERILIKHQLAEFMIEDFNVCLDYNNKKLNLIVIVGKIFLKINQIPIEELEAIFNRPKEKSVNKEQIKSIQNKQKKTDNESEKNITNQIKQRTLQLNLYVKVASSEVQIQNLLSIRGDLIEMKYKSWQTSNLQTKRQQKHKQIQILLKTFAFVYHDQQKQRDFFLVRYLPLCKQVKNFAEYEDNILKSSLVKINQVQTIQNKYLNKGIIQPSITEVNSSTSFQQKSIQKKSFNQRISLKFYYIDLMIDIEVLSQLIKKVINKQQIKFLKNLLTLQKAQNKKPDLKEVNNSKMQKNVQIQFLVYRLMINVKLFNQINTKIYGSLKGSYRKTGAFSKGNLSLPSQSISDFSNSKQNLDFANKNLQKGRQKSNKKSSNKQKSTQQTIVKRSSKKHNQRHKSHNDKDLKDKYSKNNEEIKVQIIQLCIQCQEYEILDLGIIKIKCQINNFYNQNQIVIVGTSLTSNISIKLIKDIQKVIPTIQLQIETLTSQVNYFLSGNNSTQGQGSIQKISEQGKEEIIQQKSVNKKGKTQIFFKLNEVSIKLGSLIKLNKKQNQLLQKNHKFVWIVLAQISNVFFGTKNFQSLKLKLSLMLFVCSPQTLHKNSITQNPINIKMEYLSNKQLQINLTDDFQANLDENSIQILLKYFSLLSQQRIFSKQKINKHFHKKQDQINKNLSLLSLSVEKNLQLKENKMIKNRLYDNACYFVQFSNTLRKSIKIVQYNDYNNVDESASIQSLELVDDKNLNEDSKTEIKQIYVNSQESEIIFWLNQEFFVIVLDGYKSLPISLQESPHPIIYSKMIEDPHYFYEYETVVNFQEQIQKLENKYIVHFLFNSIGKLQKIVLKHNVCIISYKDQIQIFHNKAQLIAFSNLTISHTQQKISESSLINYFRQKYFIKPTLSKWEFQINFQFLLDLNQEAQDIYLIKNQEKYHVSNILMRSHNNNKGQNNIYSLYGVYSLRKTQKQNQPLQKKQNQKNSHQNVYRLYENYIYHIKYLKTNYFVIMPFLIVQNNLPSQIQLQILDKKTQIIKTLQFNPFQKRDLYPDVISNNKMNTFDFYNKQFTLKIKLISTKKSLNQNIEQKQIIYQSEQHYFNTFFMVQHDFQTLITLRSNKKNIFDRKYLFLREQLMVKTKILKLQPCGRIINKTNFNFGLKFNKNTNTSQVSYSKSPKKNTMSVESNKVATDFSQFKILPSQRSNNHILSQRHSQISKITQFKSLQSFDILFQDLDQTKIQIKQQNLKQGWISILSFNFAQKDKLSETKQYCRLLFRIRLKTIENHQIIIIENFITFKNLTLEKLALSIQPTKIIQVDEETCFPMPPTTNKKYNNSLITLYNIIQIEALYEQIFSFDFPDNKVKQKKITTDTKRSPAQKINQNINNQNQLQNLKLIIKDNNGLNDQSFPLAQLIYSKNNIKQINFSNKGSKLFALLKDIKSGIIKLFFIQKLFNPKAAYLLIENSSDRNFLLSSDKTEYTHHFVKSTQEKPQPQNKNLLALNEQQIAQKIFIHEKSFSIMSSKQNFELFLCDKNGKHLEKSNKMNLQKQGLQIEFHNTGNFQLVDIQNISNEFNKQNVKKPKISIKTKNISINLNLYEKLYLNLSISGFSGRLLEKNKIDCLIQDVSLKNKLNNEHILRISEEKYLLFEGKMIGNQTTSQLMLIKNAFIKCKNIILNLQKDLPYKIISLLKNLLPKNSQNKNSAITKKQQFQQQLQKSVYEQFQSNEALIKLQDYLKQKLYLVKNFYIHQAHFSLSLDLENNNFSNVMMIPHYQIVNSFMREKNLFKQIGQFYKTNIVAKLPKLSFVFQNIKNPISLFKTVMKVGNALNQKIQIPNILSFDHDQITENQKNFSLQRWNIVHQKMQLETDKQSKQNEQFLTFIYNKECYYIISNFNMIILSLNPRNIEQSEETLVHYENKSQQSIRFNSKDKWRDSYENSKIRIIPLKNLQKIKLIRNKKYSELVINFKRNITLNICDEYEKCSKLIDYINRLVM